ncbi:hypothetical protein FZEAL_6540 [Fusarium zealandicum]|uniref:Uncharacterized protein n=1 Tax=Fusarium zealandicum TaxID=1053134 RepID=A0A8H4UHV9_9HYPO|nr:hypothetical protein FZEAL_6540 [Fusarium zealandicum]
MRLFATFLVASPGITGAFAGCNCKCQDPSGSGPQWNDLTEQVCGTKLAGENDICFLDKTFRPDKANQCSSAGCCIDSGGFDEECRKLGAPGAYCWT